MDRGFGGTNFGNNTSPSNFRDRYARDERRYDDFYNSSSGGGGRRGGSVSNNNRGGGNNTRTSNFGDWGGSNRNRGFFNQGGAGNDRGGSSGGNVSGQMLAALQQQQNLLTAFMNTQSGGGILPPPQNNNRFNQGGGGGGGSNNRFGNNRRSVGRSGEKRKYDLPTNPSGFNKKERRSSSGKSTPSRSQKHDDLPKAKTEKVEKKKEEIPDIPDEDVEVPDFIMDSVERLRQRKTVERNVADEDVQKLVVFCFTGKGYMCKTCGFLLNKEAAFVTHLNNKNHVMNVIDSRAAKKYQEVRDLLEIDLSPDDWYEKSEHARAVILKQSKLYMKSQMEMGRRELENYNKNPKNFFSVNMETRKSAMKSADTVTITSIVEATIEVKEFDKNRFFGCEFVKAVSGFQCRLCNTVIEKAENVIFHIDSRQHRNMYQAHLRKNSNYEKEQSEQNKDLCEILSEHENKDVLLFETLNGGARSHLLALEPQLVRVPKLLEPEKKEKMESQVVKEKEAEKEKEKNEKENENEEKRNGEMKRGNGERNGEMKEEQEKVEQEDVSIEATEDPIEPVDDADVKEELSESMETANCDASVNVPEETPVAESIEDIVEEGTQEVAKEEIKPKKSILKTKSKTRGSGRRGGRGRGGGTPSPSRSRVRKVKEDESIGEEEDVNNDGNFMDGFHVVDEVEED